MFIKIKCFLTLTFLLANYWLSATVFTAVQDGDWDDGATWGNGGTEQGVDWPSATDHAIISSNFTVTNAAMNTTVSDLTINANGIFDDNNKTFFINGNLIVNGIYNGRRNVVMEGAGMTIDGIGNITADDLLINQDITILATANFTQSQKITVAAGKTLINNGTVTSLDAVGGTGTWTNAAYSKLRVKKDITITTLNSSALENTVEYLGETAQAIKTPSVSTYYHLIINAIDIATMGASLLVDGNLTISSGELASASFDLDIKGNWSNSATFTQGLGRVKFYNGGTHSISSTSSQVFYALEIDDASIVTLNNEVQVTNALLLTDGIVVTGSHKITLGASGVPNTAGTLNYIDGRVIGNFERWLPNTTGVNYLFPIGNNENYLPANISFNTISSQGSVTAAFSVTNPGSNGFNINDAGVLLYNSFADGYWEMNVDNGFIATDFNLALTGNGFTGFTIDAETRLLTRPAMGSSWNSNGSHVNASGFTTNRDNITSIPGQFCFGDDTPCTAPSTPTISSSDIDICSSSSGSYQVTENSPNTYFWSISPESAGTFNPSPSSSDINVTIDWGATGQIAYVICKEKNTCTFSESDSIAVTINSIAPTAITGATNIAAGMIGEPYSVPEIAGFTYAWVIDGGVQASGGTTENITVDWDVNAGSGSVQVVAQKTGCAISETVTINTTKFMVIKSTGTGGDWETTSTWDCACIPSDVSSVHILAGDLVTFSGMTLTVNNFIIDGDGGVTSFGSFNRAVNRDIIVTGDFTNNGILQLNGGSKDLKLEGLGTNISGIGKIQSFTNGADVIIDKGSKIIVAGTDLKITAEAAGAGKMDLKNDNLVICNYGTISFIDGAAAAGSISSTGATTTWTNQAGSKLVLGGATIMDANITLNASALGNTVEYTGTSTQNIKTPSSSTYCNLTCSGSNTKTTLANLTLNGTLTISETAVLNVMNQDLNVAGDWTVTSTAADSYLQGTGIVTFNGSGPQSVTQTNDGVEVLSTLIINKSSGTLSLVNDLQATLALMMTSGNVDAGTHKLILGTNTPFEAPLTYSAGMITGSFERFFTSTGEKTFPIGTLSVYHPLNITINTLTAPGSLIAKFVASDPGINNVSGLTESGLSMVNQYSDGYWNATAANGFSSVNYDLTLLATGFSSYSLGSATRIIKRTNATGDWALDGIHADLSGSTANRTGLTGNVSNAANGSQLGLATTDCPPFTCSTITGTVDVCELSTNVAYSVVDNGRTYTWSVPGGEGTIADGQGSANVTINWGASNTPDATLQVIESSACYTAPTVTLGIAIHSNVTSSISGPTSSTEVTTQGPYTVTARAGYAYTWSVPAGNGVIASGQGTNSITVDWGLASAATLRVVGQFSTCAVAPDKELSVNIYASIQTQASGNWNDGETWVGGVPPAPGDNVQLLATHNVTITDATKTVTDITINSTGSLIHSSSYDLIVTGTYTNNGNHDLGNNNLTLNATTSTTFEGTGALLNVGGIAFNNNSFTIPSSSNLTITNSGSITIANSLVVTNNGTLTISGNLTGSNSSSTFINSTGSTLKIGGELMTIGVLNSSSSGNTVIYNGISAQSIKAPSSSQYYNLTITDATNNTTKTLEGNIACENDFTLSGTASLDVGLNYNLAIAGNWSITSTHPDPFVEGNGTVFLDGVNPQTITTVLAGGETFYNLTCSGSGSKTLKGNITIDNNLIVGSSLDVDLVGNYSINLRGNWSNSGTFEARNGLVTLDGSAAQTLSGNSTFYHLALNNANGVSIVSGSDELIGTLTLTNGNFTTGNALTLISDANGTARIGTITGGSITGDITMQRYIAAGATNWRFFSSPVSGATLAQFNDDFETSGYIGASYPDWPTAASPWASIYTYDESVAGVQDNGFTAATNATNAMAVGQGFWSWCGDASAGTAAFTIDLTGPANTGNINVPITFSNASHADDGWNMTGNPYPSTIDWDSPNIVKTNVNNAIYIWNPQNEQYASYVGTLGTNGGSKHIAAFQGFWIQATSTGASIDYAETGKTTTDGAFLKQNSLFPLKIKTNSLYGADELIINFENNATNSFDGNYDAEKINSTKTYVPNISSVINGIDYSINQLSAQEIDIPIRILTGYADVNTISFENVAAFSDASCLILEDLFTGVSYDLYDTTSFSVFISDTTQMARFILHIGASSTLIVNDASCFGKNDAQIIYNTNSANPFDIIWNNNSNTLLDTNTNISNADTLSHLFSGIYSIETTNTLCGNAFDTVTVNQPQEITAQFSASNDTIYAGESIDITNQSTNATSYFWDFGDFNNSTLTSPSHAYNQPGIYHLTLEAYQDTNCFANFSKKIVVLEDMATTIQNENKGNLPKIWTTNKQLNILGNNINNLEVKNVLGQLILKKSMLENYSTVIPLNHINSQVLIITIATPDKIITEKVNYINNN
jgi:hypothetical protein